MSSLTAALARRSKSRAVRRFLRNRVAVAAVMVVIFLVLVAIFAKQLEPKDPDLQDLFLRSAGPSWRNWLGTDNFGRDELSRLISATRVTLIASVQGLGIAVLLGVPLGIIAGYRRNAFDMVVSRIADALLSLPPLILAFAIVGAAGPGLTNAMIAVGITLSPRFFRIARGAAAAVSTEPYVEAARADGCTTARLLGRHILPNARGPLLVQVSFAIGFIITAEASLSFLGLGVQPPQASWGTMLQSAFANVSTNTFQVFPPAILIVLSVWAFAAIGDGLRDALGRGEANS
jgi:peptide/nickel transport system permease protein